jgi:signal transduction histidine kinase
MLNSIRWRLTLLMIVLAILPMIATGLVITYLAFSANQRQAENLQDEVALRLAQEVETFIVNRPRELRLITEVRGLYDLSQTEQETILSEMLSFEPNFDELSLLDNAGFETVRVSRRGVVMPGTMRDRSGSEEFQVTFNQREPYYSPVRFDAETGEPLMTIGLPVSEPRTGEVAMVLVGEFRLHALWDLFAAQTFRTGEDAYLVAGGTEATPGVKERVVAHKKPLVVLGNATFDIDTNKRVTTGLTGQDVVLAISSFQVGNNKFTVVSELTTGEAFQEAYQTLFTVVIGLVTIVLFSGLVGFLLLRRVTRPIVTLAGAAEQIGAGNLAVQVDIRERTEIGTLARAFNAMARQLREVFSTLEARVQARTRDLQLAAQVSEQISTILDPDQLMPQVVELTKSTFDLYHAHIYLLDGNGEHLALEAGAGEAGRKMKELGHRIPLQARSLVARTARENRPVVVNNVREDPNFMANPLLPDTLSEAAFPLAVADRVVGVLDVQSEQAERFEADTLAVFSTLAGQIAVAVNNARQFRETVTAQRSLAESASLLQATLESTADGIMVADGQGKIININRRFAEMWRIPNEILASGDDDAAIGSVLEQLVDPDQFVSKVRDLYATPEAESYDVLHFKDGHVFERFSRPQYMGDQVVGRVWNFRDITERQKAEETIRKRAAEMQAVAEVGAEASATLDPVELLWNVTDLTKERFGLYHAHIYLLDESGNNLVLAAGAGEVGRLMVASSHRIPMQHERSLVVRAGRTRQSVIVNDVTRAPDFLPNPMLPMTRAELAVPMIVGDQVIGVLDVQADRVDYFSDEDLQVQSTLASQIAVAVNNARLFEQTQRRATEMQAVAEVGAEASATLDQDELLWRVSELVKERFGLYHAHIYLMDGAEQNLRLAAGAGEVGRLMAAGSFRIPMRHERSLVVRAARTRQSVIVNDVTRAPDFLPNPMLPRTRSELAAPMLLGGRVIGVLDVQADQVNRFTVDDVRVQSTLASQIAVAVNNAQLYTEQLEVADQLRDVDRLKSEFLASMSHELRTPLNSIIGYAEVLLDGIDGDLTEDMDEDVNAIHGSGKHLLNLINDILDLAKIEAGQMDLVMEDFLLEPLVEDTIGTQRVLLRERTVDLVLDIPEELPHVHADPLRVRQVLSNLVTNALKFTEQGSVTVRARTYAPDSSMIQVSVIDTGIGMNPEQLLVIFDRFRQVDQSHTRRAGGTGLGLSITRQLVEMHGGQMWVDSEPGVGSTFHFTLPAAVEAIEV